MAESSSTAGGLDSLLEPTGSIKEAQELAARCFGAERTFFVTHTSTSPNHQLVASLDVARKQMELEGFAMVKQAIQLALHMREHVDGDPQISRFLSVLDQDALIPEEFRPSGFDRYVHAPSLETVGRAFREDELVLDPTRLTPSTPRSPGRMVSSFAARC